jgi:hypothetical protein
VNVTRAAQVRAGIRVEVFSVIWMVIEAIVLVGLALNALFHWWWAEDVAALVFLFWLVQETREALEEARDEKEDDTD